MPSVQLVFNVTKNYQSCKLETTFQKIAGVQWVAFGPNASGIAPYYTNILDTPSTYRDTKEHFDIQDMYWLLMQLPTIADEHPFRYSASIEEMKQSTLAAGRHVLLETDQEVQDLDGEKLQKKLQEANDKTAVHIRCCNEVLWRLCRNRFITNQIKLLILKVHPKGGLFLISLCLLNKQKSSFVC